MIWLARILYCIIVFAVASMWFGGYVLLRGVAVTRPVLNVGDSALGSFESSVGTYNATLGAHFFIAVIVTIVATVFSLLALIFWWYGFRKSSASPKRSLIIGMIVILFPLPIMLPSAIKVFPYAIELYEGVQIHKGPVTIHFNPDGTHAIIPLK